MDAGSAKDGCVATPAKDTDGDGILDTFVSVPPVRAVCFDVTPKKNDLVDTASVAQFFRAFVDVVAMPSATKLDTRAILFLVQPKP
jgi:hypothetical protein